MKIAIVIYSLQSGGAEKVAADLSLAFAKNHQVDLIVFDSKLIKYCYGGQLIDLALPSMQGTVRRFFNFLQRAYKLKKLFKRNQYNKIIALMEHAAFPSILADANTIVANHCNPERNFSKFDWLFAKWLYPQAKKVVAVSKQGETIFKQHLNLQNTACLFNPVNFFHIQALSLQSVTHYPKQAYFIAVGRLQPEKNFAGLIKAFSQTKALTNYQLIILGEGELQAELQSLIQSLGLSHKIHLYGFMPNPYPYIANAHALVLASWHEGFPLVLVEALALHRPVIATDCETGPREIVQHTYNGLLIPTGDTLAMTQAIDQLAFNKTLYNQLTLNAANSVQHLNIERVAQQWLEL
jgi:glycosyltransferase involved in cell wall biosynthesis